MTSTQSIYLERALTQLGHVASNLLNASLRDDNCGKRVRELLAAYRLVSALDGWLRFGNEYELQVRGAFDKLFSSKGKNR